MTRKRLWLAVFAIPVCLLSVLIIGAQRPHPAVADIARPFTVGVCNINIGACLQETNNGKGSGLAGVSLGGRGVTGQTKFNSTSSANGTTGVFGTDLSTSGAFDSGVSGLSVRGTGVSGKSTSGVGVTGQSTSAPGLSGTSTNNDGVDGFTSTPSLTRSPRSGVFGLDNSSDGGHLDVGVGGLSTNGVGVVGLSFNWVGVNAVGGDLTSAFKDLPALSIVGNTAGGGLNDLIDACSSGTANPCDDFNSIFRVDGTGFVHAASTISSGGNFNIIGPGQYQKNNACVAGCTVSATSARRVRTYAAQSSQPTVEDYGEAQLAGGQAYVRLDPAFANVMDQRANYLVFITPEGDNRGVYVTQKTLHGFVVRESQGGHSTFAFAYRIMTKPFGATEARLPMIDEPLRARHMVGRARHSGAVVPVH